MNYSLGVGESSDEEDDRLLKDDDDENKYSILKEEEIAKLQEEDIAQVSSVLSISKSDAYVLLLHMNWRVTDINDAWFADEAKLREKAGLLKESADENLRTNCGLCLEEKSNTFSAACGHPFCGDCWRVYIKVSINEDGPASLLLRCVEPCCNAAVGPDFVKSLLLAKNQEAAENEHYKLYNSYLLRSYTGTHNDLKRCSAPDCNRIMKIPKAGGSRTSYYGVSCRCSRSYCWDCEEENHSPVDCETARKWILKMENDEKHAQEILTKFIPCPSCRRPVERSLFNKHKDCPEPCVFRFCWYCLSPYGSNPEEAKEKAVGVLDKVKKLVREQKKVRDPKMYYALDACEHMVKCRQLLRWTYVYDYYKLRDVEKQHPRWKLFDYLQDHAEFLLEKMEYHVHEAVVNGQVFDEDFRTKFVNKTKGTVTFFKNVARVLEDGIPETSSDDARWSCERCTYLNVGSDVCCGMCTAHPTEGVGYWSCDQCTCFNSSSTTSCSLCGKTAVQEDFYFSSLEHL